MGLGLNQFVCLWILLVNCCVMLYGVFVRLFGFACCFVFVRVFCNNCVYVCVSFVIYCVILYGLCVCVLCLCVRAR